MNLNELLGTEFPLIQGGMANIATAPFAAAVSNAGGMGLIGGGGMDADAFRAQIRLCRRLTDQPFGVNIMLMHPQAGAMAQIAAEEHVGFITTGAGNPAPYLPLWKQAGAKVFPVVAAVALAKLVERAGADGVIAEGTESGGHVGEAATMALVPQVCDAVSIPVVAAAAVLLLRITGNAGRLRPGRLRRSAGHLPAGQRGVPYPRQLQAGPAQGPGQLHHRDRAHWGHARASFEKPDGTGLSGPGKGRRRHGRAGAVHAGQPAPGGLRRGHPHRQPHGGGGACSGRSAPCAPFSKTCGTAAGSGCPRWSRRCAEMKLAFLYAGQGSQHAGMGADLYAAYPAFRAVFDAAPADLALKELCFFGPEERLGQTQHTQPCMVAFAAGMTALLRERGIRPDYAAGLSLGEYSALHAAGVFDAQTAIGLVRFRGRAMEQAARGRPGTMAAVLKLDRSALQQVCAAAQACGTVSIANYNCPGQLVIGGDAAAVERACVLALQAGARRCQPLRVSGAFHTSLMAPAGDALRERFRSLRFGPMAFPMLFNCTGDCLRPGQSIPDLLERQVQSSVYLEDTIRRLEALGVDTVLEIGPGRVLSGFVKKTAPSIRTLAVETADELEAAVAALKGASTCV